MGAARPYRFERRATVLRMTARFQYRGLRPQTGNGSLYMATQVAVQESSN